MYDKCAASGSSPAAVKILLQAVLFRADAMYREELGSDAGQNEDDIRLDGSGSCGKDFTDDEQCHRIDREAREHRNIRGGFVKEIPRPPRHVFGGAALLIERRLIRAVTSCAWRSSW